MVIKSILGVTCICLSIISFSANAYFIQTAIEYNGDTGGHMSDSFLSYEAISHTISGSNSGNTNGAAASADLITGKLRVETYTNETIASVAHARFDETLTFSGIPESGALLTIGMDVTGSGFGGLFYYNLNLNGGTGAGVITNNNELYLPSGDTTFVNETIFINFLLTPEHSSVYLVAEILSDSTSPFSHLDFSNTGSVFLNVPEGITFTSDSGVFLTAVPIPASVLLFSSGLIGLVGMARRKKA